MASFETYGGQKIKIDFIKGLPQLLVVWAWISMSW